ncbi:hypothetical protein LTR53_009740 [Teratosphaeriaceae sp. CCFEE 6253]|nr:hypothetical protein LTR53_009740 [Teratosphaeriaceae sp. CCFEE 6253]
MADDNGRRKPQRVQLACVPCRQSKLRCSRDTPACEQCVKRTKETDCLYTERGLGYNAAKQRADLVREKVDRLESFVSQLKQSAPAGSSDLTVANGCLDPTDERSGDVVLSQTTGKLRLTDTGGTAYHGPSHWESIIEDIVEIKAYFDLQGSPENVQDDHSPPLLQSGVIAADVVLGVADIYSKEELLAFLPARPVVDRLIATWFRNADQLRLILHAPTFQAECHCFWQNPLDVTPGWLALLTSVASCGAEVLALPHRETSMLQLAEDMRRLTAHALILSNYVRPQPHIIETLLLHIKSILMKFGDVTPESHALLGCVSRLCTQGGYHRDPSHNARIKPLEAEMRRRVWDAIQAYDIKMCYQLGLVSIINLLTQDASPASNYTDFDLTCDTLPPARPLHDHTPMTFSLVYRRISQIFGDIIYLSHSAATPSAMEMADLAGRLQQARDELPEHLQMKSLEESFLDPVDI